MKKKVYVTLAFDYLHEGHLNILKIAKNRPINNPKNKEADKSFKVTTVALKSFGKLVIIKSKSINTPCYI